MEETMNIGQIPEIVWKWDVFGDGMTMVLSLRYEVPWYRRLLTKIFFGSKWERVSAL